MPNTKSAHVLVALLACAPGCSEHADPPDGGEARETDQARASILSGRLLDTDSNPVANATVALAVGSDIVGTETQTDANGD